MNKKKIYFLILISFFPVFSIKSNLNFIEVVFSFLIFFAPILLLNYFVTRKTIDSNFVKLYLSTIIIFGIDNNLGLWNAMIRPFFFDLKGLFGNAYFPSLVIIIVLIFFMYFLIKVLDKKFFNIILVFITTIFIFNIFDQTKSHHKIKDYQNETDKEYKDLKVILIFDEMSGLNSFESINHNGTEFDNYAKNFFKKHNFEFYSNIKSISRKTMSSVGPLLNFSEDPMIRKDIYIKSKRYFTEHELTQSLFFNDFNSISIFQSIHIDFCNFINVSKCQSYNIFSEKDFLPGFKNNLLTKISSIWKINGSIYSVLVWRSLRELRIIDSILEPEGHKATFKNFFDKIEKDIYSKKFDLIFAHTLVPHTPYGFDKRCNYDGNISFASRIKETKKKAEQHNIERRCVLFYLDIFLENLKKNDQLKRIDLTIMSDHGGRTNINDDTSQRSVIYAFKNQKTKFKEIKDKKVSQKVFREKFD